MPEPLLAIDFTPYFLKGFSFVREKNKIKILDSLELPCNQRLNIDLEVKLIDLILSLEKKRRINFNLVVIRVVKGGVGKEVIKKKKFIRKYPLMPVSKNEFKKIIEECQKESFFEMKKAIHSPFNFMAVNDRISLANAGIKEIVIDNEIVANPIGVLGKTISLTIINIYLPINFYKIIKRTFSKLKIKFTFESN